MVSTAVKQSTVKPKIRRILRSKPIPKLGFVEILRQRHFRSGYIPKAMCDIYQKYRPVVAAPFNMRKQPVVALMGAEANHWVNRQGRFYLRSKDYIQHFEGEFGASRTLPGMDGAEHHKMRKSLRGAYSRAALTQRLPELIAHCKQSIGRLTEGEVFPATKTFQNHISSQVSHLSIGVDCSHYIDELLAYEHRALVTHVQGAPKILLSTPSGTHTCLGHRSVELQIAVNLLIIAYHMKLEMAPANHKLRINPFPTSAPSKKLKFRVAEIRHAV